jgi:hypothetical protein
MVLRLNMKVQVGMCVDFIYMVCPSELSCFLIIRVSRKVNALFFSTFIVNLMFGWMLFNTEEIRGVPPLSVHTTYVSSMSLYQYAAF